MMRDEFTARAEYERRICKRFIRRKKNDLPLNSSVMQSENLMCSGNRTYVFETRVLVHAMRGLSRLWNGEGIIDKDQIDAVLVLSQLMRHSNNRLVFTEMSYQQLLAELGRWADRSGKERSKRNRSDMLRFLRLIDHSSMHLSSSREDNDIPMRAAHTSLYWAFKMQHGPFGVVTSHDPHKLHIKPNTPAIASAAHASSYLFYCTGHELEDERKALSSAVNVLFYHHHLFTVDDASNTNWKKPGIVFDTSTLVKALDVFDCITREDVSSLQHNDIAAVYALMFAMSDHMLWFTQSTFRELKYIVQKKKRTGLNDRPLTLTDHDRDAFLSWIIKHGCIVDAGFTPIKCSYDPDDTPILDAAFANLTGSKSPRFLISSDWHLTKMGVVRNVLICDPQRYLQTRMGDTSMPLTNLVDKEVLKVRSGKSVLQQVNPLPRHNCSSVGVGC